MGGEKNETFEFPINDITADVFKNVVDWMEKHVGMLENG